MARHGLEISALGYYANNLHPYRAEREHVNAHLRAVIDAAAALDVGLVGTFIGNDRHLPLPENLARFREIWPPLGELRRRARRQDRDRELPDDLQP